MAVYVRDVAQVIDGIEEPKNAAFLDERPALALDIQKQSGANTVAVADGVLDAVEKLKTELPPGVTLSIIKDDSTFIRESIEDVNVTMMIGGLLTVLIVYLFLNSWRSTVITGLTLPISVVAGFIAMRVFGFTLNVLTLMGLSLAIGMLIDDAIVVRENIVRHLQRGKDHFDAAARRHGRDRPRGHGHDLHDHRGLRPGGLHGRHGRPVLLRVRHHGGGGGAGLAVRQLHARPDAVLALGGPRRRAGLPPALRGPHACSASTDWFDDLHVRYERLLGWCAAAPPGRARSSRSSPSSRSFPILAILGGDFMPDFNRGEYQVAFKATPGATLPRRGSARSRWCGG